MFEAAARGPGPTEIEGVEVVIRPALTAAAADVLEADGYLLGTPANIGYMSGALKHFFDRHLLPVPGGDQAAVPTAYMCTAAWTPAARCARWSRSRPACSGGRSGRRSASPARWPGGPGGLLGTRRADGGRGRRLMAAEVDG